MAASVAAAASTVDIGGGGGGWHTGGMGGGGWHGGAMAFHAAPMGSAGFRTAAIGGPHFAPGFNHGFHGFHHGFHRRVFFAGVGFAPYYDDYPYYDDTYYDSGYGGCYLARQRVHPPMAGVCAPCRSASDVVKQNACARNQIRAQVQFCASLRRVSSSTPYFFEPGLHLRAVKAEHRRLHLERKLRRAHRPERIGRIDRRHGCRVWSVRQRRKSEGFQRSIDYSLRFASALRAHSPATSKRRQVTSLRGAAIKNPTGE